MISFFTNFLIGHQTYLLIGLIIALIIYLIYNNSYLYHIKINFKDFCFNSDHFKINADTPFCNRVPIVKSLMPIFLSTGRPILTSTRAASTRLASTIPFTIVTSTAASTPVSTPASTPASTSASTKKIKTK